MNNHHIRDCLLLFVSRKDMMIIMKPITKRIISILLIISMLLTCSACSAYQPQWQEVFTGKSTYGTISVSKRIEDYSIFYRGQLQFTITPNEGEARTYTTDTYNRLVSEPSIRYICSRDGHIELYTFINYIESNSDTTSSTLNEIDPGSGLIVSYVTDIADGKAEGFWGTLLIGLITAIGTALEILGTICDHIFTIFDFIDSILSSNKPLQTMADKFIEIITSLDNTRKKALASITDEENPVDSAYDLLYVAIDNACAEAQ